jgi:BON domain-containing protein
MSSQILLTILGGERKLMETSLSSTNLTADELSASLEHGQGDEEGHHVHLPNPSLWPLILSAAIVVCVAGLLFIPANPWISILAIPFILLGIMGWALEDPMAPAPLYGEGAQYQPDLTPREVMQIARDVLYQTVTVSSTAFSFHPVKVDLDEVTDKGVVLALYGKVELEAQRDEIENALWQVPNVVNVKNFIIAEDAVLNIATRRIEGLRSKGKLEGAMDISVLVENAILHLYGQVPTDEMKRMLERELLGIPGVRVLVNHIGLNKEIPGNLGKTLNKIGQ